MLLISAKPPPSTVAPEEGEAEGGIEFNEAEEEVQMPDVTTDVTTDVMADGDNSPDPIEAESGDMIKGSTEVGLVRITYSLSYRPWVIGLNLLLRDSKGGVQILTLGRYLLWLYVDFNSLMVSIGE